MLPSPADNAYFAAELRGTRLHGSTVLEIGFGNGAFLAWAGRQGAEVYGTELLEQARAQATAAGVQVLDEDLDRNLADFGGFFDLVVAFDVLEHLTIAQNARLLGQVAALLRPGGAFLVRFPNGQSPFGRYFQHADHTHRAILSAQIIRQLSIDSPLTLERAGGPSRATCGTLFRRASQSLRYALQDGVWFLVQHLFQIKVPFEPNCVAVLRRPEGPSTTQPTNGAAHLRVDAPQV